MQKPWSWWLTFFCGKLLLHSEVLHESKTANTLIWIWHVTCMFTNQVREGTISRIASEKLKEFIYYPLCLTEKTRESHLKISPIQLVVTWWRQNPTVDWLQLPNRSKCSQLKPRCWTCCDKLLPNPRRSHFLKIIPCSQVEKAFHM